MGELRRVVEVTVVGRPGAGVGVRSRGGADVAVAADHGARLIGVRDRVCILHGSLWPRGHRHDGNVVKGVGEVGVGRYQMVLRSKGVTAT